MVRADRWFFTGMALLSFLLIALGFGNFYGTKLVTNRGYLSTSIHIHGAIFGSWMIFFVTQNILVLREKTQTHKRLGPVGFVLALAMLVSAVITTLEVTDAGHRGFPGLMFSSTTAFLVLNINAIVIFVALVCAGLYFRRSPETHKRLMLMATIIGLTPPGISRIPFITGSELLIALATVTVILIAPCYEYIKLRTVHKAYYYSLPLGILILPPVVEGIAKSIS